MVIKFKSINGHGKSFECANIEKRAEDQWLFWFHVYFFVSLEVNNSSFCIPFFFKAHLMADTFTFISTTIVFLFATCSCALVIYCPAQSIVRRIFAGFDMDSIAKLDNGLDFSRARAF